MQYPKISIVTPNYNGGQFLEETILSVIGQNYPNLEYIIIDGGSTDNSVEIIKKYEKHLAYWVSEPDNGMYEAVKKGFDRSTGEIMAWINSDDKYHMGAFSIVAEVFSNFQEISWITGVPTAFDELGRCVLVANSVLWSKYTFYLQKLSWIQQESTFWRRRLWDKVDVTEAFSLKLAGDFALWMLFFRHEKIYSINALLGGFRYRKENQKTLDLMGSYLAEARQFLEKEISMLSVESKKHLQKIKICEKIINNTKRININSLKSYYFNLFEYPDRLIFDRYKHTFYRKKNTYFTEQIYDY